jgi:hypothetical protein
MSFQRANQNISALANLLNDPSTDTPSGGLAKAIDVFKKSLPVPENNNPPATDEQKAEIAWLVDLLQPAGATSIRRFLDSLIPQSIADLEQLQEALTLVNSYLRITQFMERIDINALVPPKPPSLRTERMANYQLLLSARAAIRTELAKIRDADIDRLSQLLVESAALLNTPTVNVGPLIEHLRNAREILRQLKQDNIDLDDKLVGQLIDNWMLVIEKLPEPNGAVQEEGRRGAVAQTIDVHNLLEAIYDLLAQDVSMENPFDLVSL